MFHHTPLTNEINQALAAKAGRDLLHLMEAERAYAAFTDLIGDLRATDGHYTRNAMWSLLRLLETMDLTFQFDTSEQLDAILPELNINDEGYTLDGDGEPTSHQIHVPLKAYGSSR